MCGGTNTVVQNSQPPQVVQDAYQNLINRGTQVANQPLSQYSGNLVAGFTPDQMSAFQTIDNSQGVAAPYINASAQLASQAATPITPTQFSAGAVRQYESPYTQDVVNSTMANIGESNAEQQQQVVGNAIQQGAFGGDRQAIAQSELARQQALAENQTIAGLQNQGYSQALGEFNTQQQTGLSAQEASNWLAANAGFQMGALGNEAQTSALNGASAQLQSGALQQQMAQEELNIPYEEFLQQQAYPYQTTNFLAGISEGAGSGMGGTSSSTSPGPDAASQIAGLGLTGLAIYGLGSSAGLWGAGAAAAAAAARGGAVRAYDNGGGIPGFSPIDLGIPDVSVSVVPTPAAMKGPGAPLPPKPVAQQDPMQQGMSAIQLARGIQGLKPATPTGAGYMGTLPGGFGEVSSADMLGDLGYGALPAGSDAAAMSAMTGMRRGGVPHMAGGGTPAPSTGGSPMIAGFTQSPGRNIAIPVLGTPQAGFKPVDINPTSFYAPPPVSSLPHTMIPLPSNITSPPSFDPATTSPAPENPFGTYNGQPSNGQFQNGDWRRGGRIHHATGGIVLPEMGGMGFDSGGQVASAGMMSAGMPFAGGNPMMAGLLRQYSQMPTEKLQEYAVRVPPTSPYGQAVRMALQMRHMNPGSDPDMQQQQAGFAQAPQTAPAPQGATGPQPTGQTPPPGTMYRGGVAGFADGGMPDDDLVTDDTGAYVPLSQAHAIGDGPDDVQAQPLPAPSQPPENVGTDIIPPPQAGMAPPPAASLAGDQPNALNPNAGMSGPPAQSSAPARPADTSSPSASRDYAASPWMPVLAAGLGMLSSRSPNALQAVGEGGLMGVKELAEQRGEAARDRQIQNEAQYHQDQTEARKQGYDIEAKRLADQAESTKQRMTLEDKRIDLENQRLNQDRYQWQPGMGAAPDDPTKQVSGAWRFSTRGDEEPQFFPGVTTTSKSGARSGTATGATQWKYSAWLAAHPGDTQGALDYAGGHRSMSDQDIAKASYAQAQNELGKLTVPPSDPTAWVNGRAADIARQIRTGFGAAPATPQPATTPAPAERPAATPSPVAKAAPAPVAKPQAQPAPVQKTAAAPVYTTQNPWVAPQGADEKAIREQFNALPPGAIYRNPADGRLYRKQ